MMDRLVEMYVRDYLFSPSLIQIQLMALIVIDQLQAGGSNLSDIGRRYDISLPPIHKQLCYNQRCVYPK